MIVAKVREHGRRAGETVEYTAGAYHTSDGSPVSVPELAELDTRGELEWVDPRMRAWVLGLPDTDEPPSSPQPTSRRRLTGEQARIIVYVVVGLIAVAAILVWGRSGTKATPTGPALPVVSASPGAAVQVLAVRGTADETSRTFHIGGSLQTLAWQVTSAGTGAQAVFCVVPAGTTRPEREFVRVAAYADGSGTTTLGLPAGTYYVRVFASGCTWSLSVTDKK